MEYAKSRFTRFWYIAEKEPIAIDSNDALNKKGITIVFKSPTAKKKNLTTILKRIIFGAVANSSVTLSTEPS